MVQIGGGRLGLAAALAVALSAPLSPFSAAAEGGEGAVGGDLDLSPGGAIGLAPASGEEAPAGVQLGRLVVTDAGQRTTTLTYFTPRLSGFELGLGYTPQAAVGRQADGAPGRVPGNAGAEGIGVGGSLAVGGGLQLGALGFGLPAGHTQDGGSGLGLGTAGLVTAGVGYDFGGVNTNVTYGFTTSTVERELDLFAVSADMAVVPGVAVTGGVAVSAEETGDRAAAGMFGIRLNF